MVLIYSRADPAWGGSPPALRRGVRKASVASGRGQVVRAQGRAHFAAGSVQAAGVAALAAQYRQRLANLRQPLADQAPVALVHLMTEIGRASCRERVCI